MTDQFKRNVAFKFRIGDILVGKPIFDGERFGFLELGDKKIIRVNIIGNIIDKYENDGEKKYCFLTIDDGSGQIKAKFFGEDVDKFKGASQGQTVLVIGNLRNFNNETYIAPEIITEKDTRYLLIRKLELEKEKNKNSKPLAKEQIIAVKDKILNKIKEAESEGGVEIDALILNFRDISPEILNQEIKKLIEEGIVFEPRPGKLRWLG